MKSKPVIPSEKANLDIDEAIDHYLEEGSARAASGFVRSLERAFANIGRQPGAGSPHVGRELDIPGLRAWPLRRYPHIAFYVEREEHVDVWRVLHAKRDMPSWLLEDTCVDK